MSAPRAKRKFSLSRTEHMRAHRWPGSDRASRGTSMLSSTGLSGSRLARRLIIFYAILAVIVAVVVVVVITRARREGASPRSPADTSRAAPARCLGSRAHAGGRHAPAIDRADRSPRPGPSFNVLQSGQFVNFTNNQRHLGGSAAPAVQGAPRGRAPPHGNVELRVRRVAEARRNRDPRSQGLDRGHPRRVSRSRPR